MFLHILALMQELRWNPLLGTYTMVAANRQGRPHLPKGQCPFCPGSGKVPDNYEVLVYDNDFPALSPNPLEINEQVGVYRNAAAYGKCEVILYTSDHDSCMSKLSEERILKVVETWADRQSVLSEDKNIKYIYPFENRGEEVGVTMHHPHGQLYAYPFVPLKLKTELDNCKSYYEENGSNLFDDMNKEELKFRERIIAQNESFLTYLPYFTDYPFGIFIVARNKKGDLSQFTSQEKKDLAQAIKKAAGALDTVFDRPMPYMMCIHQTPVNSVEYADAENYFRFHIEFYPVLREKDKVKWYASSESGAWAAANTLLVEDCAIELRKALSKFEAQNGGK